jgi:hypothetical protein
MGSILAARLAGSRLAGGDKGNEYCTCDELGSNIEGRYSEQHALHGLCSHNSSCYTECGAGTDLVAAGRLLSSVFL